VVQRQQTHRWHDTLTLDESWFYSSTDNERIMPTRNSRFLTDSAIWHCPLTVAWSLSGFHVLAAFARRFKFNAGYDTADVLERTKNWWTWQRARSTRKLIVHADNAMPQQAK
jgi:hypothetical protein